MQLESSDRFESDSTEETDLYEFCLDFLKYNELDYFAVLDTAVGKKDTFSNLLLMSNWPSYVVKVCDDTGFWRDLPWFDIAKSSADPLMFEAWNENGMPSPLLRLFQHSGLGFSIGYPLQPGQVRSGMVVLSASSRPARLPDASAIIDYSTRIFGKRLLPSLEAAPEFKPLSKREHECLVWTSQGKTSYEIGMILGLSENTINNYLVSAGRKLRAVNRPHLVSIALREGIID